MLPVVQGLEQFFFNVRHLPLAITFLWCISEQKIFWCIEDNGDVMSASYDGTDAITILRFTNSHCQDITIDEYNIYVIEEESG